MKSRSNAEKRLSPTRQPRLARPPSRHATVADWMTPDPITITLDVPAAVAWEVMAEHEVRRLPVVDSGGELVGIVTQSDLQRVPWDVPPPPDEEWVEEQRYESVGATVGDAYTPDPVTISADKTIGQAAELMLDQGVSGLPVVDADHLVGILTESDIFRILVYEESEQRAAEATEAIAR
jgi:CBS domain-containing protein